MPATDKHLRPKRRKKITEKLTKPLVVKTTRKSRQAGKTSVGSIRAACAVS